MIACLSDSSFDDYKINLSSLNKKIILYEKINNKLNKTNMDLKNKLEFDKEIIIQQENELNNRNIKMSNLTNKCNSYVRNYK